MHLKLRICRQQTPTSIVCSVGLSFEAALREYLESFRLPGESQKIYRILESWSRQFFRQCPGFFRTSDAVLILAFSLILLNTDKHNRTVNFLASSLDLKRLDIHYQAYKRQSILLASKGDLTDMPRLLKIFGMSPRKGSIHSQSTLRCSIHLTRFEQKFDCIGRAGQSYCSWKV